MTSNDTHPLFEAAREAPLTPVRLDAVESRLANRGRRRSRPALALAGAGAVALLLAVGLGLDWGDDPTTRVSPPPGGHASAQTTPAPRPTADAPSSVEPTAPTRSPGFPTEAERARRAASAPLRAVAPIPRRVRALPGAKPKRAMPLPKRRGPAAPSPATSESQVTSPVDEAPTAAPRPASVRNDTATAVVPPEPLPAPYQPRAIREFLRVDWERWEERELPAAVARMVAARDPVGLLAALDALPVQGTEPDLLDWRASLRGQLEGVSTRDAGRPDPGPR